ncbi:hypothetical protein SAMN05216302_101144 [Nitrosomonas aestuarii]|uniref:DUF6475 domain-containing protein n=1 Tax=Nitrosomonas aestuarii TaxID=52441 RepID=A0A1I4B675_9PROT|nr:DUF6475 domain-containing protein [Nitrosomonas aestuarii]SFK64043.1 hypothetical protein SAMN05216302_101144 [Nitrosomonas aestuarii]
MTENDFEKFRIGLSGVHDFYEKSLSDFTLDLWWNAMKRFDLKAIVEGFNRHVSNPDQGKWMPKPADIIKMIKGGTQDSALIAWAAVDKHLRQVGTYQSIIFDDPLIHRVLSDMGGWILLGTKKDEEWPFVAKEFEARYRGYKSRNEIPDYPSHLIGIAEMHNAKENFRIDPPFLAGNREKALMVYKGGNDHPELENGIGMQRFQKDLVNSVGSICNLDKEDAA